MDGARAEAATERVARPSVFVVANPDSEDLSRPEPARAAVRLVSGRDAHGVEVGVVVAADPEVEEEDELGDDELPAPVPAGAPAPAGEVVGGGETGAGVTFGVGSGTDKET